MAKVGAILDMIVKDGEGSIEFNTKLYTSLPSFCNDQLSWWELIRRASTPLFLNLFVIDIFINVFNYKQFSVYSCVVKSYLLKKAGSILTE